MVNTVTLYLVRHAHATWSPDEDRPLSDQGRRDAQRVADLLGDFHINAIFSSDYRRAIQTVQPLAIRLGLEVQFETRFRERALGEWTAPSFESAVQRTWLTPGFTFPGGESNRQAQKRALLGLQVVFEGRGRQIVISTHGNLLALLLNYYDPGVGFDFWSELTMPDVYRLEVEEDGHAKRTRVWM